MLPEPRVVKRFDTQAVARTEQLPLPSVPDRERVHPDESLEAGRSPARVRVQHHLGIGRGANLHFRQLAAQLRKVVDLAVVDDRVTPVRCGHRLAPGLAQIDDLESSMPQHDTGARPESLAVRAPVPLDSRHARHDRRVGARSDHARNTAHQAISERRVSSHSARRRSNQVSMSTESCSHITYGMIRSP